MSTSVDRTWLAGAHHHAADSEQGAGQIDVAGHRWHPRKISVAATHTVPLYRRTRQSSSPGSRSRTPRRRQQRQCVSTSSNDEAAGGLIAKDQAFGQQLLQPPAAGADRQRIVSPDGETRTRAAGADVGAGDEQDRQ